MTIKLENILAKESSNLVTTQETIRNMMETTIITISDGSIEQVNAVVEYKFNASPLMTSTNYKQPSAADNHEYEQPPILLQAMATTAIIN